MSAWAYIAAALACVLYVAGGTWFFGRGADRVVSSNGQPLLAWSMLVAMVIGLAFALAALAESLR